MLVYTIVVPRISKPSSILGAWISKEGTTNFGPWISRDGTLILGPWISTPGNPISPSIFDP